MIIAAITIGRRQIYLLLLSCEEMTVYSIANKLIEKNEKIPAQIFEQPGNIITFG